jgi:isopentenyl diphosphate isomerase/L-lactate dehydrogenase-like FMN-dependent dehydrogenase
MPTIGTDVQVQVFSDPSPGDSRLPFAYEDWERRACAEMHPFAYAYVAHGSGGEDTMRANREALYRHRIWPRVALDVGDRDLSTTVLGTRSPAPFFLAPVGVQGIIHPQGERATARAAAAMGVPFTLSTVSSVTLEEVASIMGAAPRWFQLYAGRSHEVISSMIRRAEAAGYSALVLTLDTTMLGWREADLTNAFLPFLNGDGIANYLSDPAFLARLAKPPNEDPQAAIAEWLRIFVNPSFGWNDVDRIRGITKLPFLLKGIMHPADAELAIQHGADGIIVSNHGGRQVDGAVGAADALPVIADAVRGRVPVLMDSGIRRGADVLKAIALGASAVMIGRPYAFGLAVAGEAGVRQVIRNLQADTDLEMGLSGLRSVREISPSLLSSSIHS